MKPTILPRSFVLRAVFEEAHTKAVELAMLQKAVLNHTKAFTEQAEAFVLIGFLVPKNDNHTGKVTFQARMSCSCFLSHKEKVQP